jgi:GntR family transcriptional regulator
MPIQISTADGLPIYQQIFNQVRYLVASGHWQAGEELPPIRVLAEQLTVNPNTVARAYLELERAGVVTKQPGSGTYVSKANRGGLTQREKNKILVRRVDSLLVEARHLGVELNEVLKLVREREEILLEKNQARP